MTSQQDTEQPDQAITTFGGVDVKKLTLEDMQALTSWKDKEVAIARLKGGHHALADLDKWIELHELDGYQIKEGIVHMMESLKQQVESLQSLESKKG